tara:strand:- start:999 stop:2708 length:1710 start_codon:yes stop_codon:yes gene_type:complete
MAQTIKIKRSTTTAAPSTLTAGELAYSDNSDKLFIGAPADNAVVAIGGKVYVDMLDHTAGILTASSAIVVDSNSKVNKLLTGLIQINNTTSHIDTSSGDLTINPASNLVITTGSIDLSGQATEFKLVDNSSTALTISEGSNNYITIDTTNSAERVKFSKQVEFSGAYTLPTADGSTGQALITDGSGAVAFTTISTELDIAGDSGTDTVSLISDTLTFTGGEGIDTAVTNNIVTISGEDASTTNKGVASFDSTDFTVSSGAVSVNTITLGSSSLNAGETTSTLAGLQQLDVDNVRVDTNTISTTNTNGHLILAPNGTGTVTVPSGYKDRAGFGATSLVSKEYVDAIKQALDVKASVTVATTANLSATYNNAGGTLTNSGSNAALQLDGITVTAAARVLVKDQSTAAENGIYVVTTVGDGSTAWVLTRAEDANASAEMTGGVFTFVEQGTIGAENGYVFTHNGAPTLGTTALTVSQFSGAGQIVAGDALSKSGNRIDLNDDNITLEVASDTVRIKGITATAVGDLLIGAASNAGYTRLVKPSGNATASDYILSMNTSGVASWANTLDGGTF